MLLATSGASGLFLQACVLHLFHVRSVFEMSGLSMSNAAEFKHVRWCGGALRLSGAVDWCFGALLFNGAVVHCG